MAVVPGGILINERPGGRMDGDVLEQTFARDQDPTPVMQGVPVFSLPELNDFAECPRVCSRKQQKTSAAVAAAPAAKPVSGSSIRREHRDRVN